MVYRMSHMHRFYCFLLNWSFLQLLEFDSCGHYDLSLYNIAKNLLFHGKKTYIRVWINSNMRLLIAYSFHSPCLCFSLSQ